MELIQIEKLKEIPLKNTSLQVKVTEMGNIIEVQYMSHRNNKQTIQMLPGGEQFVILATGEVVDVKHGESRKDNKKGIYKSFANIRALINTNVTDVNKVRWCTLTYAENMTDTKQLYSDFEKFNKRFQYYCKRKGYSKPEYIVMMEPQGRGAWHAHLLYIWGDIKAPYIPNKDFRELWSHGFVKIKKLDDVDNVGAYLTAYLGDMDISDALNNGDLSIGANRSISVDALKEVEIDGEKKYFIKGARLNLYPIGFNMVRCSRGVKRPVVEMLSQKCANKKVSAATKTFENAIKLTDTDNGFETVIIKEQYNKIRK